MASILSFNKFEELFNNFNKKYNINGKGTLIGNLGSIDEINDDIESSYKNNFVVRGVFSFILETCSNINKEINNKNLKMLIFNKVKEKENEWLKELLSQLNFDNDFDGRYKFTNKDLKELNKNVIIIDEDNENTEYSIGEAFFIFLLPGHFFYDYRINEEYKEKIINKGKTIVNQITEELNDYVQSIDSSIRVSTNRTSMEGDSIQEICLYCDGILVCQIDNFDFSHFKICRLNASSYETSYEAKISNLVAQTGVINKFYLKIKELMNKYNM